MQRRNALTLLTAFTLALAGATSAVAQGHPQWLVFLETGKPTPDDKERVAAMQRGHLGNFKRLFGEKKLFAAGPLRDPQKLKRGIVVVQAATLAELTGYFQPDEYVREGYMTLNAVPVTVNKALNSENIDPSGIEEVRIVLIDHTGAATKPDARQARRALLEGLMARGVISAWYSPQSGPISEIIFTRSTDNASLTTQLATYPGVANGEATLRIWSQWIGKGVVR